MLLWRTLGGKLVLLILLTSYPLVFAEGAGRTVGRSCRAPSRSNRSRPRCTRFRTRGTLTRHVKAGASSTSFTGRIGSRALAAGGYRALLGATDAEGNVARTRTLNFTVVAG